GMSGRGRPRWSAERRASRVTGRKAPRKRLACRVHRVEDARESGYGDAPRGPFTHPNVSRRSAPPPSGGWWGRYETPGQQLASGTMEWVLFEVVSRDARPHPEERACRKGPANWHACTRVSKDEDGTDLGFTRDRQNSVPKSATADLGALMLRDASRRTW